MFAFKARCINSCGGSARETHFRSLKRSKISLGGFFLIPQNLVENFAFWPSMSRRGVGSQRRGVATSRLLNVATLPEP